MMLRFFGYRSFEPEYETMKAMRKLGINVITIMVSNNTNFMGEPYTRFQPTWIWERVYDFSRFDQNVRDVMDAVPDVKLNVVLDLNPPQWWLKRGPNRCDPFKEFGRVAPNNDYREDVVHYLQALLKHAVTEFPGRFLSFAVMGGRTTEWFDDSLGTESIPRIEAWHKWCAGHDLPLCDVPGYSERYSGVSESGGLLRTPENHAVALAYWKFNSEMSAETVGLFLKKAREVLPDEVKIGITYGYIYEIPWKFSKASWGQLEYEHVFDSPDVDFAAEPISYGSTERGMGGAPMAMIPLQTLKVRGKFVLNSIDTTTFTSRFPKAPGNAGSVKIMSRGVEWHTPEEVTAGLRREMCYNLINGCATWHFDMWGGWYDSETARQTLGECKRIWDSESTLPIKDVADILLVADPENMYYINDSHSDGASFIIPVRKALSTAGGMFTTASFNDLARMDLTNYKLIIFCHPFDLDHGKLENIQKYCSGKTILWIYAPGIIHNRKWDPENMQRITGAEFGGSEIHYGDKSVYVPAPKTLTEAAMRQILQFSGVHSWTAQSVPVYANARLLAIHIGQAGKAALKLPAKCERIDELFRGNTYRNTDYIELEANGPETLLFRYGE